MSHVGLKPLLVRSSQWFPLHGTIKYRSLQLVLDVVGSSTLTLHLPISLAWLLALCYVNQPAIKNHVYRPAGILTWI